MLQKEKKSFTAKVVTKMKSYRVIVFGVFDQLHPGHLFFLKEAGKYGLVVAVVARDKTVKELKNKTPLYNERKRAGDLLKTGLVDKVVLGDKKLGTYGVIKKYNPTAICLGYDQGALKKDLEKYLASCGKKIKIIELGSYEPKKFHTSLLKK